MPFLQRCVSSQELKLWGCQLRPTLQAAPFLSALGAKRQIRLEDFECWRKLLQDGKLRIKDLKPERQMDMEPGAVILVDKSELLFLIAVFQPDSLQTFLDDRARQEIGTVWEKWLWYVVVILAPRSSQQMSCRTS